MNWRGNPYGNAKYVVYHKESTSVDSFISRFVLLPIVMTLCCACSCESYNKEYEGPQQEYNEEELLKRIKANPDSIGLVAPPWDTPPVAVGIPSVPDLSEIGFESFEGFVGLWITINVEGIVDTVRIIRSSGHRKLDSLALDTTQRMTFMPAKKDGKPIKVTFPVPFSYVPD